MNSSPPKGFFLDDPDDKRKRYCLICHTFKPERCHHCSTCNRCVLNMDHHCPWLNNCIGFYNRKFFLLFLGYTLLLQLSIAIYHGSTFYKCLRTLIVCTIIVAFWSICVNLQENEMEVPDLSVHAAVLLYSATLLLMIVVARFLRFHIWLVTKNRTTIENLEFLRNENAVIDVISFHIMVCFNGLW